MNRLIKADDQNTNNQNDNQQAETGNSQIVLDILKRVENSADDIQSAYYSLLDNLNALNKDYAGVYNEFKLMVKLPNENDVREIVNLKNNIDEAIKYLSDKDFLSGLVK